MVVEKLKELLDNYSVKRDFTTDLREEYRKPLESDLNSIYEVKPNYRYGGSLAKGTANNNSSDMDLLCYFDDDYQFGLKAIYDKTYNALIKNGYICQTKNSAIYVTGKIGNPQWEITIDVVPGKYTSNDANKDVYLWCNKDNSRLKSNPEKQIDKVKLSKSKDVIRLIKLYREFNNFSFKSFFLEIFAIDIVELEYEDNDSIYDKLVKFCSHYDDIGKKKIYDPANSNNDIMTIHNEYEFDYIRKMIKRLYDALLTNDSDTIINCIKGYSYNIEEGYDRNAYEHAPDINRKKNDLMLRLPISLKGYYKKDNYLYDFTSSSTLHKNMNLKFEIQVPLSIPVSSVCLIVSNSGYEALHADCLRGNKEETKREKRSYYDVYVREESTSYIGNHCVQAIVTSTRGTSYYSDILRVKVR